jgi:hypothetical protein
LSGGKIKHCLQHHALLPGDGTHGRVELGGFAGMALHVRKDRLAKKRFKRAPASSYAFRKVRPRLVEPDAAHKLGIVPQLRGKGFNGSRSVFHQISDPKLRCHTKQLRLRNAQRHGQQVVAERVLDGLRRRRQAGHVSLFQDQPSGTDCRQHWSKLQAMV